MGGKVDCDQRLAKKTKEGICTVDLSASEVVIQKKKNELCSLSIPASNL